MYITERVDTHRHTSVGAAQQRAKRDIPLLPLTKASPYDLRLVPLTYSSVFSRAMFM